MDLSKVVSFSRNFSVLVKVHGPDPKGLKMRRQAFHHYNCGNTTLSASGMLFPSNVLNGEVVSKLMLEAGKDIALVLTVASVVEPFLTSRHRDSVSQDHVELIPGARVEIMVEGQLNSEKEAPFWAPAQLLSLVDVPVSSGALQSLIETSSGSKDSGWDVGWSLVSADNGSHSSTKVSRIEHYSKPSTQLDEQLDASSMAKSATRMALLGVSLSLLAQPNVNLASSSSKGDTFVALGSPFGIVSPVHFFNSVTTGSISNCYPSGSAKKSLMIADVRCLPGMEGAPVFDKNGHLIGILVRPIRQKNSGVEIQLVVPWGAITTACSHLLVKEPSNEGKASHLGSEVLNIKPDATIHVQVAVEKSMESICLITINDGVWASGVLLNEHGLILTNAHLLEPWRFGRGGVYGEREENGLKPYIIGAEEFSSTKCRFWEQEGQTKTPTDLYSYKQSFFHTTGHKGIRVRLFHQGSWTWCPAKTVYICKEKLDVALLQLEHVPGKLQPITADFSSPLLGSSAHVVGHGLFGPRCGLSPSICSGVVAKVVYAKKRPYMPSVFQESTEFPAMLETTAAVHPGGSGGAVVNSSGHMIGLVTSNARHGAGTVIPHLNFSIPCAVLAPIFKFAQDMDNMEILQTLDQPNEELSSIWALMPSLSPKLKTKTEHSLPKLLEDGNNNKQEKGSRFAKFIAESQDMFIKPIKPPRDMIPSKL
ncbi:unnamed protein product [Cochlearia groenlandica]